MWFKVFKELVDTWGRNDDEFSWMEFICPILGMFVRFSLV